MCDIECMCFYDNGSATSFLKISEIGTLLHLKADTNISRVSDFERLKSDKKTTEVFG